MNTSDPWDLLKSSYMKTGRKNFGKKGEKPLSQKQRRQAGGEGEGHFVSMKTLRSACMPPSGEAMSGADEVSSGAWTSMWREDLDKGGERASLIFVEAEKARR